MKIIFPHIPKCAGSSIKQQLAGRGDVYFDYFNHPTWIYEPDREAGRIEQIKLKNILTERQEWIIFGHFASNVYSNLPYDMLIILLRDPLERAISHFHYVKQSLPDNEITRRRHEEVAWIKEDRMTIEEFVELHHIKYFYSEYYLKNIIIDERLLVLPVENIKKSFDTIFEKTGIQLSHSIWVNKGNYRGVPDNLRKSLGRDTSLYNDLINRTD